MAELLVEIYSEEIPAKMQNKAADDFQDIFCKNLQKNNIDFQPNQVKTLISPRRITFYAQNLPKTITSSAINKKGPNIKAPNAAIQGFLKANNLDDKSQLTIQQIKKDQYYFYLQPETKITTSKILADQIPIIIKKMSSSWPKTMKWQNKNDNWIRPIRNILAIFDSKIIDFTSFNLKSNNQTFGHLLKGHKTIQIGNFDQYIKDLQKNQVIIDQNTRKQQITDQVNQILEQQNLKTIDELNDSNPLFNEVVGLAQNPQAALGCFDEKFLELPQEVLTLTIKSHQKYFCLKTQNNKLSNKFILISDNKITDQIIKDHQKTLKARLSDAAFFISQDLKTPLIDRHEQLKNIIFTKELGNIYEKTLRVHKLNRFTALWIKDTPISLIEELSFLAKADLTSRTVAELPELQAVIGSYYAKIQKYDKQIIKAIQEQYLPVGINDNLPKTPLGILISICDKIDTICGLFSIDQKPTSSKDPMALRRSALGIIRIILKYQFHLPLKIIIQKAINNYDQKILKNKYQIKGRELKFKKQQIANQIIEFFSERLKYYLKSQDYRSDVINAVFNEYQKHHDKDKKYDIIGLYRKIDTINDFLKSDKNIKTILLYKRASNIVNIEEKKQNKIFDHKILSISLKEKEEKNLFKLLKIIEPKVKKAIKQTHYSEAILLLEKLALPIDNFFEKILVNCDNQHQKEIRLTILSKIRNLFNLIIDFNEIKTS